MKLDYCLTPYTKVNSKWVKDLNVSHKTLRRKHRKKYLEYKAGQLFPEYISLSKGNKIKKNKWDYIKLKSICTAKDVFPFIGNLP